MRGIVQAKLNVGPVDDPHEREADRISRLAMGSSAESSVRRSPEAIGSVPGAAGGVADPGVERAVTRARAGGRPVPDRVRQRMERVSGVDLGGVRVHVDAEADRLNEALGARAFTVGADVFVRRDEYRPGSARGDALLGHELTHVVQQSGAGESVQRLLKNRHPWHGVMLAGTAVLQKAAGPVGNPQVGTVGLGQRVQVTNRAANFLRIDANGVVGYVPHTVVDEATANRMQRGLGDKLRWKNSDASGLSTTGDSEYYGTDFAAWALGKGGEWLMAPGELTRTTTLNCWEAILYAAYKVGALTWRDLNNVYTMVAANPGLSLMTAMVGAHPRSAYVNGVSEPERGDLVFFNGLDHVALAAGQKLGTDTVVYSFWPAPDVAFSDSLNGTVDRVKECTIEELVTVIQGWDPTGPAPVVEFADPAWTG
ncbi:eCIS core domain-containing protein [Streptomyces sp. NPDC000878]